MIRSWILWAGLLLTSQILAQNAPDPAELERLNTAISKIQAEVANTRSERSGVAAEVQTSEKAIQAVIRQIQAISDQIAAADAKLVELRTQADVLESSRSEQQNLIGDYLKNAWMNDNQGYLKLLLSQKDPQQSARMLRYYQYFNTARAAKITAYNQTLADLQQVTVSITATTDGLRMQQDELQKQQNLLATALEERQQILARLDSTLNARGAELASLEEERGEMARLLEELRRSISNIAIGTDQEPFKDRKGKLEWPLDGRISQTFGSRHTLGDLTWEGVTIAGTAGADVRAIHHGRVVFADWFSTSGLLLIIDHGDGYMSLYAHNQDLFKTVGEWVAAGQVIAAVGNTGGNRDYGLYFEIRHNGKAQNPSLWCAMRK